MVEQQIQVGSIALLLAHIVLGQCPVPGIDVPSSAFSTELLRCSTALKA